MQKAFRYRVYLNKAQRKLIHKSIGCARFVYNYFLAIANKGKYQSYTEFSRNLTSLKKEKAFLKEVDKFALQNSLRALDDSFKRFFKGQNKIPNFKNKKRLPISYKTNFTNNNVEVGDNFIKLPKLKKVRAKIHRKFEGKIINAIISKTPTDEYYVSICVEVDNPKAMDKVTNVVGLDSGLKSYLVTSEGVAIDNPKCLAKHEEKLAKEQRKRSRKKRGSNNYKKQKKKVAKIHDFVS